MRPELLLVLEFDDSMESIVDLFKMEDEEDIYLDLPNSNWYTNSSNLEISRNYLAFGVFYGWGEEHDPKQLTIALKDANFLAEFLTNPRVYCTMNFC